MNLFDKVIAGEFRKTGATKKISVPGNDGSNYDVYAIPLKYLYYNDQNGRINTAYRQYQSENGVLAPEPGDSEYNQIFEKFVLDSNSQALKDTLKSIKEKTQQEPGVVLPDGRVIDGNRRFTALRMYQRETNIEKYFEAVILNLDTAKKSDEKTIKELELDLQLGREERVDYDPIDRIFDVYNTIKIEKLMTVDEYKKASGAGNTRGINRDLRLAELILRFISLVSPGGNAIDKFYLARDLKIDGPIEEIGGTLDKLTGDDKEAVTDAVLVRLLLAKSGLETAEPKIVMRDMKNKILKNPDIKSHLVDATEDDDKLDDIVDAFVKKPIASAAELKQRINEDEHLKSQAARYIKSTNRLAFKGDKDGKRRKSLSELEDIYEKLSVMSASDFTELNVDENAEAKDTLKDISDVVFKLKKELRM